MVPHTRASRVGSLTESATFSPLIFDNMFHLLVMPASDGNGKNNEPFRKNAFRDESLPDNYVPYNVQAVGHDVVVTYALHEGSRPLRQMDPASALWIFSVPTADSSGACSMATG